MDFPIFRDRQDAGRRLAAALAPLELRSPLVLALPRGGVPVAHEAARALQAPLDVVVVRKIGAPGNPELAMGAVGPAGTVVRNEDILRSLQVDPEQFDRGAQVAREEVEQRQRIYRGDRDFPDVSGCSVVLVDDGLATGATARAGLQLLRTLGPRRVVLAVPVLPQSAIEGLQELADDVVHVLAPERFMAVGAWYEDFGQTSDQEVLELLQQAPEASS